MSLNKILFEVRVTDQEQVLSRILQAIGHKLEDTSYMRSGSWGDVFKIQGKKKVIKLTTSPDEVGALKKVVGKDFKHVVNIYYFKAIPKDVIDSLDTEISGIRWSTAHLLVMEELEPTGFSYSTPISLWLRGISRNVHAGIKDSRKDVALMTYLRAIGKKFQTALTDSQAKQALQSLQNIGQSMTAKDFKLALDALLTLIVEARLREDDILRGIKAVEDAEKNFLPDVIAGLKELDKLDIFHSDMHLDNIMKDPSSGRFKIIDIQ